MHHPFRRNEVIHAFWRSVGACVLPTPGMVPCFAASAGASVGSGDAARAAPAAMAEASPQRGSRGWGSSSDVVDCYHACASSKQRVATPWISLKNFQTSILQEFSYSFVVLRYGRSCKEVCGTIL